MPTGRRRASISLPRRRLAAGILVGAQKLLDGGRWYPQVMGLEPGTGTDRLAGERARFFMSGTSEHEIVFQEREGNAVPRR
jgi:hypothetical protein